MVTMTGRKLLVAIFCVAMINLSTSISTIRADLSEDVANAERVSGKRPGICVMAGCNCTVHAVTIQVKCKFTENQVIVWQNGIFDFPDDGNLKH